MILREGREGGQIKDHCGQIYLLVFKYLDMKDLIYKVNIHEHQFQNYGAIAH